MNNHRIFNLISVLVFLILILVSCNFANPGQEATPDMPPTPTPNPKPIPRSHVSMAYDSESDKVILFGGTKGSALWDTWAYDVKTNLWTYMNPPEKPSARMYAGMAYDSESDRIILHGGAAGNFGSPGDFGTYAYDYNTNTWEQMAQGSAPGGLIGENMVYDSESDRIILLGGGKINHVYFNQVYAYDYNSNTWTDVTVNAPRIDRALHGLAYDRESDRIIIWGGSEWDNSTWAYDYNNNSWEKMPSAGEPDARRGVSMTYDAHSDRVIVYGGAGDKSNETWAYDYNTNTWTNLGPTENPGFLGGAGMVFSSEAGKTILYGGTNLSMYFGDTWIFDFPTNNWNLASPYP